MTFSTHIRSTRRRLKLSQTTAAKLAGVSLRTWQHWESGKRAPWYASEQTRVLAVLASQTQPTTESK